MEGSEIVSKVVLVLDEPKNCWRCPCIDNMQCDNCKAAKERRFSRDEREKLDELEIGGEYHPDWCPLGPLEEFDIGSLVRIALRELKAYREVNNV